MALGLVVLVLAGAVSGYASGLFGIGGGVVLVPTFMSLFPHFGAAGNVVMHCAVGTCLALVVPAAVTATRKQLRLGNLERSMLRSWLPWVAVGTVAGALTVQLLRTRDLKILFTVYLFASAIYVALSAASERGESTEPSRSAQALGAVIIANLSVWLGLGGGTFTVPYLRAFHYPMKKAIAVSSASGLLIGAGGAVGAVIHGWGAAGRPPYSVGFVDGVAFVVVAPIVMVIAPLGAKAAARAPDRVLKWTYVALLVGIGTYVAFQTATS